MRKLKIKDGMDPGDINLTPMMDLFVVLIPFLLMSAAFVRLGGVQVAMPSSKSAATELADNSKLQTISLTFEVSEKDIKVRGFSDQFVTEVSGVSGEFSLENEAQGLGQLRSFLEGLRSKYQNFGSSLFHAAPTATYEQALHVLDTVHSVAGVSKEIILAAGVVEATEGGPKNETSL